MRAARRQAVDDRLQANRCSGGADRGARDPAGFAEPDPAVWAERQAERPIELVGQHREDQWRGALAGRGQCELEQTAASCLPASHVDQPETPWRDLEDAARKAQARRPVGEQRDALARQRLQIDARIAGTRAARRVQRRRLRRLRRRRRAHQNNGRGQHRPQQLALLIHGCLFGSYESKAVQSRRASSIASP